MKIRKNNSGRIRGKVEVMMKIYFEKTNGNNLVIITDGETAKIFDAAPSGIYEGVDLYAEDAADQLREKFRGLEESGELNDFNEIYSPDEMPLEDLTEELEKAVLVFDSEEVPVEYQSGQSRSGESIVDYMRAEADGVELYAEAEPVEDDEIGTYDELRAEIIRQAEENGIDTEKLRFWLD